MKITKHYQFILVLIGLYIISFTVKAYCSVEIAIIINAMIAVPLIVTIICWIMFTINKKNNNQTKRKEKFRLKNEFQRVTGVPITDDQEKQIIDLGKRVFGKNIDVKIIGQILTAQGQEALGSYRGGMIKILKGQADTGDHYIHESVHAYLDVFTTADEQAQLLIEAQKRYGIKDFAEAEKMLVEHFISYTSWQEQKSPFKIMFDQIITRIKIYFGNEYEFKKLYSEIYSGKINRKKYDEIYPEAKEIVINSGRASAEFLQRSLKIRYARAARLLEMLEENGVIGPADGAKPRKIII